MRTYTRAKVNDRRRHTARTNEPNERKTKEKNFIFRTQYASIDDDDDNDDGSRKGKRRMNLLIQNNI